MGCIVYYQREDKWLFRLSPEEREAARALGIRLKTASGIPGLDDGHDEAQKLLQQIVAKAAELAEEGK